MTVKYLADAEPRARRSHCRAVSTLLTHACLLNCVYVCVLLGGGEGGAGGSTGRAKEGRGGSAAKHGAAFRFQQTPANQFGLIRLNAALAF